MLLAKLPVPMMLFIDADLVKSSEMQKNFLEYFLNVKISLILQINLVRLKAMGIF